MSPRPMPGCRLPKTNDYLNADAMIAAARAAGADAVHPGYGFLSENAEFAAAVQAAGLAWIGPPVDAVRAMGSKIESKKLMAAAGVPGARRSSTRTPSPRPACRCWSRRPLAAAGAECGWSPIGALPAEVAAAQREAAVRVRRPDGVL